MGKQKSLSMAARHGIFVLCLFCVALALPADNLEKKDASSFLRVRRKARNWTKTKNFKHAEAWNEYKDELEEMWDIPEEEVDNLESCISSHERKDEWCDLPMNGCKSHEETRENKCSWGQNCIGPIFRECFAKIPKHAPADYRPNF